MVFREVSVIEVREALRAWLAGKSERAVNRPGHRVSCPPGAGRPDGRYHDGVAAAHVQGIDNIGVCVTDLRRSVEFCEQLGATRLSQDDRGVTLGLGQAKLFVFQARRDSQRRDQRALGLFGNPPGIDHISFLVDDPDELHAQLRSRGVEAGPGPFDQDWGARAFGLQDPDGVNLYFLWL